MNTSIADARPLNAVRQATAVSAAVVGLLLLNGCTTSAVKSNSVTADHEASVQLSEKVDLTAVLAHAGDASGGVVAKGKYIHLTPWTNLGDNLADEVNPDFAGAYTHLVIASSLGQGAPSDNYAYIDRGALARFFAGSHRTINLTAKVGVGKDFTATVPLVTVDHISDSSNGEAFSRVVNHSAESFPLFLVHGSGSNETVSVTFEVKATNQYQASASAAIQAIQSVLKAVAPHSAVLTTLTQQGSKDAATALDATLGKLLATTLDESQGEDYDIRKAARSQGPTIELKIPDAAHEGQWNAADHTVGTWTVGFADPRPSIFSDQAICGSAAKPRPRCSKDFDTAADVVRKELVARAYAYEVLNYPLIKDTQNVGSISGYIKQQDWYTGAQKWMNNDKVKDTDVTAFCKSMRQSIVALNLNGFDAGVVVWAEGNAGNLPKAVVDLMKKDKDNCISF